MYVNKSLDIATTTVKKNLSVSASSFVFYKYTYMYYVHDILVHRLPPLHHNTINTATLLVPSAMNSLAI